MFVSPEELSPMFVEQVMLTVVLSTVAAMPTVSGHPSQSVMQ